ncbi:DUF4468 domain-containing protein [Mucilaginibacter sp. McL0603]|uniref:DUF4468 domain-containing protein n=1 Tax=Mucilaginibacter sp. McL0603 TaxID=3415670 RepID=UPI003CF56660
MKILFLSIILAFITLTTYAQEGTVKISQANSGSVKPPTDSVKLQIDGNNAYYQKIVKVDSSIKVSEIFLRALQFMAGKNFQQTYGYQQEGKLIFTTTQDLNINPVTTGTDLDNVEQYSVQFAITIDMKNGRYRYTVHNVVFFRPTDSGNSRLTLYDMHQKATGDTKWVAKDARKVITSFERYLSTLTAELNEGIEHKSAIYQPKF